MIAWWWSRWRRKRRRRAASCCRTPPRRSRSAARCWRSAPASCSDNGKRLSIAVAVGDEVLYGRYAGNEVEVNGKDIKIMRESDILAKVSQVIEPAVRLIRR